MAGLNSTLIEETNTDGVDTWPLLTRDQSVRSHFVYNIDVDDQSNAFQFAVRKNNYKLIWGQTKEIKQTKRINRDVYLYNLADDPEENFEISAKKPEIVQNLKELIKSYAKDLKMAFQPNAPNLGYPRYHQGLLEPGWCTPGWWDILWKNNIAISVLEKI